MQAARPGASLQDIHRKTVEVIKAGLLKLGLITDASGDQYRIWYTHGASHYIGIDVHDVGDRTRAARARHGVHDRAGHLHPAERARHAAAHAREHRLHREGPAGGPQVRRHRRPHRGFVPARRLRPPQSLGRAAEDHRRDRSARCKPEAASNRVEAGVMRSTRSAIVALAVAAACVASRRCRRRRRAISSGRSADQAARRLSGRLRAPADARITTRSVRRSRPRSRTPTCSSKKPTSARCWRPRRSSAVLTRGMLPVDQSLDKVVSPATFALVTKRVGDLGIPIEPLKRFKPWMLALTLVESEWQKAGFDAELRPRQALLRSRADRRQAGAGSRDGGLSDLAVRRA